MKVVYGDSDLHYALAECDVLVAGAGLSGAVLAERMASQAGKRVVVLDKRSHVAGNCFDRRDEHGILIHQYGPHIFHTNRPEVVSYLSQFTDWLPYEHRVLAKIEEGLVPVPFNLNSIDACFPMLKAKRLASKLLEAYGDGQRVPIMALRKAPDPELAELAEFIFQRVFLNYTIKQWGIEPGQLSESVLSRVPVVLSRDDRYFQDAFQKMPKEGYTRLVERMLSHSNIQVALNREIKNFIQLDRKEGKVHVDGKPFNGRIVYTGPLDELFDFELGELSYRSLQFEFEHFKTGPFQPCGTVNYPNTEPFTRITEFRYLTGQLGLEGSTIVREYPQDYDRNDPLKNIPYYPVLNLETEARYQQYLGLADRFKQLLVCGRLGDYRYFNMDDAVHRSLQRFNAAVEN